MIGTFDTYYASAEVSNSDLSQLESYFMNKEQLYDIQAAYRFGNLIDAMITEPNRVDHLNLRVDDEQFNQHEWAAAKKMLASFRNDPMCMSMLNNASGQAVKKTTLKIEWCGFEFELPVRCKFDLWMDKLKFGGDIKSTTATTQAQFEASIKHFNYDKQRAFYMDIAESNQDMLIGISKVNYKVFKVPIKRGDALYASGKEKYSEWAFKYWCLFEGF